MKREPRAVPASAARHAWAALGPAVALRPAPPPPTAGARGLGARVAGAAGTRQRARGAACVSLCRFAVFFFCSTSRGRGPPNHPGCLALRARPLAWAVLSLGSGVRAWRERARGVAGACSGRGNGFWGGGDPALAGRALTDSSPSSHLFPQHRPTQKLRVRHVRVGGGAHAGGEFLGGEAGAKTTRRRAAKVLARKKAGWRGDAAACRPASPPFLGGGARGSRARVLWEGGRAGLGRRVGCPRAPGLSPACGWGGRERHEKPNSRASPAARWRPPPPNPRFPCGWRGLLLRFLGHVLTLILSLPFS